MKNQILRVIIVITCITVLIVFGVNTGKLATAITHSLNEYSRKLDQELKRRSMCNTIEEQNHILTQCPEGESVIHY